jgi:hypothetical protein
MKVMGNSRNVMSKEFEHDEERKSQTAPGVEGNQSNVGLAPNDLHCISLSWLGEKSRKIGSRSSAF